VLSARQIDQFATVGFVVLRGCLAELTLPLREEVDIAIRDAYAATYDERVRDGISGHYLPMASLLTPTSTSLVCDDRRFIDAAEDLLGGAVIPECPEGVLYFAEAGWHNDDGIGVRGVKFATYFDHLGAANGALRLVPGSHRPERHDLLVACRHAQMPMSSDGEAAAYNAGIPGQVAETVPGDVIAFDLRTWHASTGGLDRLAWSVVYQRLSRDRHRDRTHASVDERQLRAGLPRVRPAAVSDLAGLAGRRQVAPPNASR